jgi:stage II sporulation protein D
MRQFRIWICLLWMLILGRCAFVPPPPTRHLGPEIRVGLITGRDVIEFSPTRPFEVRSADGQFFAKGDSGEHWLVSVQTSKPGKIAYRLVAGSMSTRDRARDKARNVEAFGYDTEIKPVGYRYSGNIKADQKDKLYRIYLKKEFETEAAVKTFRDSIRFRFESFMVKEMKEEPSGLILLQNETGNLEFESAQPVLVIGSPVALLDIPVGAGFHWEQKENRTYPETVSFQLDADGKLAAVNTVPVEIYLEGVVPSEMHPNFPEEALKAQAVAARSKTLANLGLIHPADPFDFCADVHCQVYSGLTRASASASRAIKKTAGLVLWENGKIGDALYGSVCGGHTEDVDKAWLTTPKNYLQGVIDGPKSLRRYGPLDDESNARRWILDSPPAFCNTLIEDVPEALNYTKNYFRWEVTLSQDELRGQIEKRVGRSLGSIRELIPISRGVSGRIIKLKIVGTDGDQVVEGELNIRKLLSPTTLWSSCFVVEKMSGISSAPVSFTLRGAGWGHGIGMCQTGAAGMALKGKKFNYILKHYYRKGQIKRLY